MCRIVMPVVAAALAAASCDSSDAGKRALVDECVRDGTEKEICVCVADAKFEHMDKDLYRAEVLIAQGKTEDANMIAETVGPDRMMKSVEKAMPPILACAFEDSSS